MGFQSAPANYSGRINLAEADIPALEGFNPRPPITAGESSKWCRTASDLRGFNPRPPITAGESQSNAHSRPGCQCFNPRPPITAGESPRIPWRRLAPRRFNPRPPITAGESPALRREIELGAVSIRARQLQRANQDHAARRGATMKFQFAPANYSGRIDGRRPWRGLQQGFQSAPANYSGRIA